jgi:NAD(P)-dependent dehydrogenase (short-subunit alcohol dehydrogenase family)
MNHASQQQNPRLLEGKCVLITGGTSGIGLATAALFTAHGASVLVCGRSEAGLSQAAELPGVIAQRCDVTDPKGRQALFATVKEHFGRLDSVFCAAGIARFSALADETPDSVLHSFQTNVAGTYFVVQEALPYLQPGSSLVLCGSVAGQVGCPYMSVYAATKAAVRSLARSWAVELAPQKVRVNCLAPGPTETPIHTKYGLDEVRLAQAGALVQSRLHLGHMASAHQIAQGALFLASDASAFMTGQELVLDGGVSC